MVESLLLGCGFAFAAVVQPGPMQAFFLSSVAQRGWKRTLPAALAPLISDGPIAVLILFIITNVPTVMTRLLQAAGGLLLLYLGWNSYQAWRVDEAIEAQTGEGRPSTLFQAAAVNLLNPNPYLGWSLVLGPAVITAWGRKPIEAAALVAGFYAIMILGNAAIIVLLGTTTFLGRQARRTLILFSAIMLAVLGIYQLTVAIFRMGGG